MFEEIKKAKNDNTGDGDSGEGDGDDELDFIEGKELT